MRIILQADADARERAEYPFKDNTVARELTGLFDTWLKAWNAKNWADVVKLYDTTSTEAICWRDGGRAKADLIDLWSD